MTDAKVKMLREAMVGMRRAVVASGSVELLQTYDAALAATAEECGHASVKSYPSWSGRADHVCQTCGAEIAATAEPAQYPYEIRNGERLSLKPSPAPRDAHQPGCYALPYPEGRSGECSCRVAAPRDAEREALLAFGERVREACAKELGGHDAPAGTWGHWAAATVRALDLAALLPVKP